MSNSGQIPSSSQPTLENAIEHPSANSQLVLSPTIPSPSQPIVKQVVDTVMTNRPTHLPQIPPSSAHSTTSNIVKRIHGSKKKTTPPNSGPQSQVNGNGTSSPTGLFEPHFSRYTSESSPLLEGNQETYNPYRRYGELDVSESEENWNLPLYFTPRPAPRRNYFVKYLHYNFLSLEWYRFS
jgi:hypothetical protein